MARPVSTRLDDRKFRRPPARDPEPACPNSIYNLRRSLNDISVLSKSCDGRSFSREKAVIWRMSLSRKAKVFSGTWRV
jgi:hypothetical protein